MISTEKTSVKDISIDTLNSIDKANEIEKSFGYYELKDRVVELYDLSPAATIKLLNYSENMTYLVEDKDKDYKAILRVNRPNYHTKEEINAELAWMGALLKNSGIIVPEPLAGRNGEHVQTLYSDYELSQYCVMISYLEGNAPDHRNEKDLVAQFEMLGEVNARLHNHVQNWGDSNNLYRFVWDFDSMLGSSPRWGRWQEGPDVTEVQLELFQRASETIKKRLSNFGKKYDRFGLIHADLRLPNLLVDGGIIKVIDFDDCGYSWFLYDLAAALSFIEHKDYVPFLVKAWLRGYKKVRKLSKAEEAEIPTFIMLRRLILLAWLGTHHDSDTAREEGTDFAKNTEKLARRYLAAFER